MAENNTLIIYHSNCDDGFGAAYAAWLKYKDNATYLPMGYGDALDLSLLHKKDVIIADFSFNPTTTLEVLSQEANSITILDHHKSSMDEWKLAGSEAGESSVGENTFDFRNTNKNISVKFDMSKSGALMAWEHFYPGVEVPKLIHHISDADLFQFKDPDTRNFKMYLRSMQKDFNAWELVEKAGQDNVWHEEVCRAGKHISNYYDILVQNQVVSRKVKPIKIEVENAEGSVEIYKGLSANASLCFGTDLGSQLAIKSGTFGLVWETNGRTCFCSIRSIGEFNCIPIAKKYGGGGHRNASGFKVSFSEMRKLLTN